jgi:hypothetical protein
MNIILWLCSTGSLRAATNTTGTSFIQDVSTGVVSKETTIIICLYETSYILTEATNLISTRRNKISRFIKHSFLKVECNINSSECVQVYNILGCLVYLTSHSAGIRKLRYNQCEV